MLARAYPIALKFNGYLVGIALWVGACEAAGGTDPGDAATHLPTPAEGRASSPAEACDALCALMVQVDACTAAAPDVCRERCLAAYAAYGDRGCSDALLAVHNCPVAQAPTNYNCDGGDEIVLNAGVCTLETQAAAECLRAGQP